MQPPCYLQWARFLHPLKLVLFERKPLALLVSAHRLATLTHPLNLTAHLALHQRKGQALHHYCSHHGNLVVTGTDSAIPASLCSWFVF